LKNTLISSELDVFNFLTELKSVINHPNFDPDNDLDILTKKKSEQNSDPYYTTQNTLLTLDFDHHDVATQLNLLTKKDYLETFIDDLDPNWPPFYNFGQVIQGKEVYIKVKIRDKITRKIFCVSFHFARHPLAGTYPYV
jgi:hypothetical protein